MHVVCVCEHLRSLEIGAGILFCQGSPYSFETVFRGSLNALVWLVYIVSKPYRSFSWTFQHRDAGWHCHYWLFLWVLGSELRFTSSVTSTLPIALSSVPRSYTEECRWLALTCQILHSVELFIVCIDHKELLLLPQWFCLTSFETYLNWGQFWKPPAGFTCHLFCLTWIWDSQVWLNSSFPSTLRSTSVQPQNPFFLGLWPLQNSACELKCPPSGKKSCLHFPTSSTLHMASELA